ncbi:MAG: VCBS repeat-containing protein [Ignavibacteriota bacterium]
MPYSGADRLASIRSIARAGKLSQALDDILWVVRQIACTLLVLPLFAAAPAQFSEHTVGTGLRGGYQVVIADLNHDGKPDLIALASGMPDLVWYENPGWQRHTIASGFTQMINVAAVPSGLADGIPDLVLASGFANVASRSVGLLNLLRHSGDPREPWNVTEIDRLTTSHRLRTADIDGSGRRVVIDAALTGAKAEPPDYRDTTPLVFYRPGEWKRQDIAPHNSGLVHGIYVIDWDGDGRDEILTAGFEGIYLFKLGADGAWARQQIATGSAEPWPKSGSSDIAVGRLAKERFLAAIEPWHGNQVAVYLHNGAAWKRAVIDDTLADGHTILTADFDGSGRDTVVAGCRGGPRSVFLYTADDPAGRKWTRQTLDGEMPAAACAAGDLNGDGRIDIACIGSATGTLKWYENRAAKP